MTEPATGAFLSGQGIPVALGDVERTLAELWGSAAEPGEGEPHDAPAAVTRLVLANLLVADLGENPQRIDTLLESLAPRYPSRILVLRKDGSGERAVRAEVTALCHLPAPGLPQVCSEQIVLRAPGNALDLLPGAIRPLLLAEVPLVLWWNGDPGGADFLFRDLADESSRLIIDLPDPVGVEVLERCLDLGLNRYGRDLAWFGISPWRELVAQFFDPPGFEKALASIREVTVECVTPGLSDGCPPRHALWLIAWLAGALGWAPRARGEAKDGRMEAVFQGGQGPVIVRFEARVKAEERAARLTHVSLDAGSLGTFRLRRREGTSEVMASTDSPGHDALPRWLPAPEWECGRRLAAALESARDDPPYRKGLPHLLWLAGQGAK